MRALKNDFYRAFTGKGFYLAVFILCVMQCIGQRENFSYGRNGSLITNIQIVLGGAPMSWLFPGIGTLCFADACIKDIHSNSYRYQIARMPLYQYVFSKICVCFLAACIATMLGTAIYLIVASAYVETVVTPEEILQYSGSINSFDALIVQGKNALFIILHILCEGLCAGMWATVGMMLSTLWNNMYVAIVAPAVLLYAKDYIIAWLRLPSQNLLRTYQLGYIANVPGVLLPILMVAGLFGGISCVIGICMYVILRRRNYA